MKKADENRIVAGIDIGTSKVCALVARVDEAGKISVAGAGVAPNDGMKKGLVVDIDKVSHAVFTAVDQAEKAAGCVAENVYVTVSGNHVTTNAGRGSAPVANPERGVAPDDVRRALDASKYLLIPPDKKIIGVIENDFTLDGHGGVTDPVGMAGSHLEVNVQIVTGATASVQNLLRSIDKVGIEVDAMMPAVLASGEAVLNSDEKKVGILLIDFGAGTTSLAMFRNGFMTDARVIPIGSSHIDNDIAVVLGTSPADAEKLKIEYGSVSPKLRDESTPVEVTLIGRDEKNQIPRGMLCQVIQPRIAELLDIIVKELRDSFSNATPPAGIVITGGGAHLPGMIEAVEQKLGYHVRLGKTLYAGENAARLGDPRFTAAAGLLRCAAARVGKMRYEQESQPSPFKGAWLTLVAFFRGLFK